MGLSAGQLRFTMWGTTIFAVTVSVIVWGQGLGWDMSRVTMYKLFPLLGLLAFGLMWSHYITGAARHLGGLDKALTRRYFTLTSLAVLALILLHPGLLIFGLWNDGFGLPPGSYLEHYVAPGLKWAVLLGSISLLVFLAFELHRWFGDRSWWRFVQYATDLAMLAIVIHGFKLGTHLQSGWFRVVWLFYAVTLLASIVIIHTRPDQSKAEGSL